MQGIGEELAALGLPEVPIRSVVRTGDTPQSERARMRANRPHIVVTTPESLYILLTSQSGRDMLSTCRTVIVDEIHAMAGNKRGAHLALSLERLQAHRSETVGADRTLGDAKADRGSRAVPERGGAGRRATLALATHRRCGPRARPGSRAGAAADAARGGDVGRGVDRRCTTGSPSSCASTAPRWCSSTRAGWPSASRGICPSASARRSSPRITAASPGIGGSTPSSA